ncbi:alpha/beta hydrolase [Natranaerobius trueperi]|uniref:alpha/beta hydrolase n=1 Tax=Natranaerobius trueperi TaxID=759412 RepID=UPI0013038CF1|nr:alpha/beta fold hydrolase [Natranaerobius trueperi]
MSPIKINKRTEEAFYLPGGDNIGCLLVHGFTGTPGELEPLGKFLNNNGYSVYAPLLSGHGTTPEDLAVTTKDQILNSARKGLKQLRHCNKVIVMGLSMGGLISGIIAKENKSRVKGLVLMGTPIYLSNRMAYFAKFLKYVKPYVEKVDSKSYSITPTGYDKTPVSGVVELLKLRHEFLVSINKIEVPTLVVQGMKDGTVKKESGQYIFENLKVEDKKLLELEKSKHIVTLDVERDLMFEKISTFLKGSNLD